MLSEKSIVSISPRMLTWQVGSIQGFPRVAAATPNTLYNCLWSSVISDPVTVVSVDWWQSPTKHVNDCQCDDPSVHSYLERDHRKLWPRKTGQIPDFQLMISMGFSWSNHGQGHTLIATLFPFWIRPRNKERGGNNSRGQTEFSQRTLHQQAWQAWKVRNKRQRQPWGLTWMSQEVSKRLVNGLYPQYTSTPFTSRL